jgi:hypothetical protein
MKKNNQTTLTTSMGAESRITIVKDVAVETNLARIIMLGTNNARDKHVKKFKINLVKKNVNDESYINCNLPTPPLKSGSGSRRPRKGQN